MELSLNTRHRELQFESDARLLVFDRYALNGSDISDEVRNLISRKPLTRHIYIAAPFISGDELQRLLTDGGAAVRAAAGLGEDDLRLWMLDLRDAGDALKLQVQDFAAGQGTSSMGGSASGTWIDIPPQLVEGWLFDLFESSGALVHAPAGVHFTKSSGKHSTAFLRASSTLLSTAACGFIAMVALARLDRLPPRRMFVDTSPLLSVAYAMSAVANARGYWTGTAPVQSFSSYGGKDKLPLLGVGDIVLISASTSGGLAKELLGKGVREQSLLTLFFLASEEGGGASKGSIACDLTVRAERTFGYLPIKSYAPQGCALCAQGYVKAELEGDQFLLDRRSVKRLRLLRTTQHESARKLFEKTARSKVWAVSLYDKPVGRTGIELAHDAVLAEGGIFEEDFARLLERYAPTPLDLVVCYGISAAQLQALAARRSVAKLLDGAAFLHRSELESLNLGATKRRNALVVFDVLQDHSQARTVNALLRGVCNGGNVAYIAALSVAETARSAKDLEVFLTFGSRGADTFTYKAAGRLLLPYNTDEASPWDKERALLQRMGTASLSPQLATRLSLLGQAGLASEELFLPALTGQALEVSPDFVFLDTIERPEEVSQADIYAIVSNVLACARAGESNADIGSPPARSVLAPSWRQTSLFQTLLCPSNFKDFNDAVLRAALLRAATEQEMNYVLDDLLSAEMLDLLIAQVHGWNGSAGDSLPEFLLALATGRLRLTRSHTVQLRHVLDLAGLPEYVAPLVSAIRAA